MKNFSRKKFEKIVLDAIGQHHGLLLYGSFSRGTFHYEPRLNISFSDIDLISSEDCPLKMKIVSNKISEYIYSKTGVKLPVSVRKQRIHNQDIPQSLACQIAYFELMYKSHLHPDNLFFKKYQIVKYLLRFFAANIFFSQAFFYDTLKTKITKKQYFSLLCYKTGHCSTVDESLIIELLNSTKNKERINAISSLMYGQLRTKKTQVELEKSESEFLSHPELYSDLKKKVQLEVY